jgi:hypothetical protein
VRISFAGYPLQPISRIAGRIDCTVGARRRDALFNR